MKLVGGAKMKHEALVFLLQQLVSSPDERQKIRF